MHKRQRDVQATQAVSEREHEACVKIMRNQIGYLTFIRMGSYRTTSLAAAPYPTLVIQMEQKEYCEEIRVELVNDLYRISGYHKEKGDPARDYMVRQMDDIYCENLAEFVTDFAQGK